jgi:predicted small secreted protein
MRMTLLALLVSSTILTGCSTTLHPIGGEDIQIGGWCKEGWKCFSSDYVKYIMKVRIEEKAK